MKGKQLLTGPKKLILKRMPTVLTLLFLLILVGTIVGLSGTIKAEKERLTSEKMGAIAKERAPVNVVLLDVVPTTIQDRINPEARLFSCPITVPSECSLLAAHLHTIGVQDILQATREDLHDLSNASGVRELPRRVFEPGSAYGLS